ncbi:MAG: septum formation inhibitor Maf [Magnetococcales bacterium]|nr:septum formation inhibitor Maf [Magnetococcales bacterium]
MESTGLSCCWLGASLPPRICLASASPRRLTLLRQVGIDPMVHPTDMDESRRPGESVREYVKRMAIGKARLGPACGADVIIGADTIVVLDQEVLGKPAHADEARQMLARIAGRAHDVLTAVALYQPATRRSLHRVVKSRVWIKPLTPEEIAAYVATGEPLDKAGSYGIQGMGAALVTRLEGSCSGVAGLPLWETLGLLREFT